MARSASTVVPSGREEVVEAIVTTAAALFAAKGPDAVSLRSVAAAAGVNYGLIHQYVGTKDDLLRLVFRSLSERAAADFAGAGGTAEVLDRLLGDDPRSPYGRMLAWALLQERDAAELLGRSPAMDVLIERIAARPTEEDPRVLVAAVISMALGWRLFGPFVRAGAGLDDVDAADLDAALRRIATGVLGEAPR